VRIVVAPDAFKGSLSAAEAAEALAAGLRTGLPGVELELIPVADGGEGTAETLARATGGELRSVDVSGPLGEPVQARYAVLGDGTTAVVEMAEAAGLVLVPPERRDPTRTTTYGVGQLIEAASSAGCSKIIVGLGGSATCDGGAGLGQAMGFQLVDAEGESLGQGGGALARLHGIGIPARAFPHVVAACDVDNPLCGERGAARVYAPQKGATPAQVEELEANLSRLAEVIARDLRRDVRDVPGAGAAGGLGAGLLAFAEAQLRPGVELVLETLRFAERLQGADLVVVGEGRLDGQTLSGKAPLGVARLARAQGIPVVAVAGSVAPSASALLEHWIQGIYPVVNTPMPLEEAMQNAAALLERAGRELGRLLAIGA
jgi:glycerate kinase